MYLSKIGYVSVDTNWAEVGLHVPMVSPPFDGHLDHCLQFDYKVWMSPHMLVNMPPPRLEVYISGSKHVYSGWMLWSSNGIGEGHVQVSIRAQTGAMYRISFVGVVGHPDTTLISVANIHMNKGNCTNLACLQEECGLKEEAYTWFPNCENAIQLQTEYNLSFTLLSFMFDHYIIIPVKWNKCHNNVLMDQDAIPF